jgi:Fe2+ transport system protein FeoA
LPSGKKGMGTDIIDVAVEGSQICLRKYVAGYIPD